MDKIIVRNSCIIINDYNLGDAPKLERTFSKYDPIRHTHENIGLYYDEENHRMYIPSGVDLGYIKYLFHQQYYKREDPHPCKPIENILMRFPPRDERQAEALRFTCAVRPYEDNAYLSQLSLNLSTGVGKTYVSIATIAYLKMKAIIITASNTLLHQWKDEIVKYTNVDARDIMQISGSDKCNMILQDNSMVADRSKIFLCSHGTLRSFGDTYGWDKVYSLFEHLGIGVKIYDEAHLHLKNTLMIDYFTNVYKTYYVTATPARSNRSENYVYQLSLKNVPSIDLFDEQIDAHVAYCAIRWNSHPSPMDISKCRNKYGLDRNRYVDYVTQKPEFYSMMYTIMDLILKVLHKDRNNRVIVFIGTNEGILRVYKWIMDNYARELAGDVGIFTSAVPKEQKLAERDKRLILSTTKSAGAGEDIKGLKATFVIAEPFKSEVLARQTLGRIRDKNGMYFELVDMGFRYINRFYNAKLPIFNKYAEDVSDMMMDTNEIHRRQENIMKDRTHPQECPISFDETRFDMDKVHYKKEKQILHHGPISPVTFIPRDDRPKIE